MVLFVTRRTSGIGRRMESILAQVQVRDRDRLQVRRVDADDSPEIVRRLEVREIPSIVIFKNRRRVAQLRGRTTLADVERALALSDSGEAVA